MAYWCTNYWEQYSIEVAVVAVVLATTLALSYLNFIDGSLPFIAALFVIFLIILLTNIQKIRNDNQSGDEDHVNVLQKESDAQEGPPHYDGSIEGSQTSVMKPYPPSEVPLHHTDNPPSERATPEGSLPPVAEPDPELDTPATVNQYPGVPRAESPDDAERVLSENGHNRRELETEYEGQVSHMRGVILRSNLS